MYGYFQEKNTGKVSYKTAWTLPRKGNLRRKFKFLLITTQPKAIKTNYAKLNIDIKEQQVSATWRQIWNI